MKIAICSDVHLEFGPITLENTENADVLILSGDICVAEELHEVDTKTMFGEASRSIRYHDFFQNCCARFPHVIYIMGNHEHYHGDFRDTIGNITKYLAYLPNLHVLDKSTFVLNDVMFIGGTLWTDMNHGDALTMHAIRDMMADFRWVMNSNRMVSFKDMEGKSRTRPAKFTPADALEDHDKMMQYIRVVLECATHTKYVVVGHHAPSKLSTHPRYADQYLMNGGFSSDLSEFILNHPQIKLWTHGHTHDGFDYTIGSTRIVCNPRGYANYERQADEFKLKFVEI
jgi:Icc-related predicted phosphoesterase